MRQIEPIEFNVKFITPLLIHGANPRIADSIGITGKALRGCWRFWFRALVGGMISDMNDNRLKKSLYGLESLIFGLSDESIGAINISRLKLRARKLGDPKIKHFALEHRHS